MSIGLCASLTFYVLSFSWWMRNNVTAASIIFSKIKWSRSTIIVNKIKNLVEPFSAMVNAAFLNYRPNIAASWGPSPGKKMKILKIYWLNRQELVDYENQDSSNYSEK